MTNQLWKLPITRACVLVLRDSSGPMHYKEITRELLARNVISSRSAEVERCVYSGMSKHIRQCTGESWFYHAGPGLYGLTPAGRKVEVWRRPEEIATAIVKKRTAYQDLTWPDAVLTVLEKADKPLTIREILLQAWNSGLKQPVDTLTPTRTVGNLLAELARTKTRVGKRRVQRVAAGTYALR